LPDGRLRRWLTAAPFPPAPSSAGRAMTRRVRGGGARVGNSRARTPTSEPGRGVRSGDFPAFVCATSPTVGRAPPPRSARWGGAGALHVLQPTTQRRDPVARQATIGLDLRLSGSPGANSAAEALEVAPQAAHPREVVLELGQLDLELARGAGRVGGEDVEDH